MSADRSASLSWAEGTIAAIGKTVSWFTLAMVLLTFVIVVLRYGFNLGWIWLQESVIYLHAAVFMLAAAWTFQDDGHVRVDIFYRQAAPQTKAWVNLAGCLLFLIPFCVYLLVVGLDYVAASWRLLEGSREAGGIPLVYLLKSLILAFPALMLLQSVAIITRSLREVRHSSSRAVSG